MINEQMVNYKFDSKELVKIAMVHDNLLFGPRAAFAYYIGHDIDNTQDLDTSEVENFIVQFYGQFNNTFGMTY